ncbi:MAG: response regulator [Gemmatimonadota bacterium]|nr:MAG: response regulator [Gemmatimonadota bacterium]
MTGTGDGRRPASVLIVDDEAVVTSLISKQLSRDGYACEEAASAEEALKQLERRGFDVVIADIRMPQMSGIDLLKVLKQSDPEVQVIMITGNPDVDIAVEALRFQADDYLVKPFELGQLSHAVARALEHRELLQENRLYREGLEQRVVEQSQEIERLFLDGLRALAAAIEARDRYTGGHLDRVSRYALATADEMGLYDQKMWSLWLASMFHDVGKLAIPDSILNKPGPLTEQEYAEMKLHPVLGAQIVKKASFLIPAALGILHHQERWDGEGYPSGLVGDQISVEGRILAVADAFDAMLSDRPYRPAQTEEYAVSELERCAGTQFDPTVVRAFLKARANGFPGPSPYEQYPLQRVAEWSNNASKRDD